jgi:U3 small nucleolar RNA-associated protein 12
MAGERLAEALDVADGERKLFQEYEKVKSQCTPEQAMALPLPQRNAILAAYEMDPTTYVLTVLEKIQPAALTDALLVLPFSKVLSLLLYLEEGFRKVRLLYPSCPSLIKFSPRAGTRSSSLGFCFFC